MILQKSLRKTANWSQSKIFHKQKIDTMTTPPSIYLEVPITYGEMIESLIKLGYHREVDGKINRFINEKFKSEIKLPLKDLNETVEKIYVAGFSYRLYLQSVIKKEEDLIKMIQKSRLKKNKVADVSKGC